MNTYKHKDQAFYQELCKMFPSFEERFQKACKKQWYDEYKCIVVNNNFPNNSFCWEFYIPKTDIEEISPLKPNIWYSASEFDGNPNKYSFIGENNVKNKYVFTSKIDEMPSWVTRFMYLIL